MNTAPGTCVECGNDAYIRLAGDADERMICAHCFAARGKGLIAEQRPPTPQPAIKERPTL